MKKNLGYIILGLLVLIMAGYIIYGEANKYLLSKENAATQVGYNQGAFNTAQTIVQKAQQGGAIIKIDDTHSVTLVVKP